MFNTFEQMNLHILLLTDGMFPYVMGGMQKHTFSLCEQLLAKDVKVSLFHAIPKGVEVDEEEVRALFSVNADLLQVQTFQFPDTGKLPGHYVRENVILSQDMLERFRSQEQNIDLIYAQGFTGHAFVKEELEFPVLINFSWI